MFKSVLVVVVLVVFSSITHAEELDCSVSIEKMTPYKGVVGEVLSVEESPNTDRLLMGGEGTRIDFSYKLPNRYIGWTWAVFKRGGIIKTGQKVFWSPADREVRETYPDQDRQVFIVMGDVCRPIQVDISFPAEDIVGL